MGVASVISNVLDYGMAPALAVDVARVDAEKCCTIELEQDRVPVEERQELIRRGHRIEDRQQYHPQFSPLVQVTGIAADGRRFAASDPRYERGAVAVAPSPVGQWETPLVVMVRSHGPGGMSFGATNCQSTGVSPSRPR
jgi:gamma-glutamyltranspeptidase